jgi:hypothetical protein
MKVAVIWDRVWWSLMLAILVGLIWLKFVDPVFHHSKLGLALSVAVGMTYLAIGIARMLRQKHREDEVERAAREELRTELNEGSTLR